jgi:hypothetical protein
MMDTIIGRRPEDLRDILKRHPTIDVNQRLEGTIPLVWTLEPYDKTTLEMMEILLKHGAFPVLAYEYARDNDFEKATNLLKRYLPKWYRDEE